MQHKFPTFAHIKLTFTFETCSFFLSSSVSLCTHLQSRACLSALMSWDLSQVCIFVLFKADRDKGRKHPGDPIWPWQFSAPFHPSKRRLVLPDSCLHCLHDGKCMLEMFSAQHVFFSLLSTAVSIFCMLLIYTWCSWLFLV